jgi:hypothetical protein
VRAAQMGQGLRAEDGIANAINVIKENL